MAVKMIEDAERQGLLKPGGTIIEGTSGNTGMGLAIAAIVKGYKCIFTTTDKQSKEKMDALRAFGAEVIVCPTDVDPEDPRSYYSVSSRLVAETPNSWKANQYDNLSNSQAHYESTGPEIWEQTEGKITYLVGGIGTGGTISGAGRFLKEKKPGLKVIAVDPVGSVFYNYFKDGKLAEPHVYMVEGIGEDMVTAAMDFSVVDDIIQVTDQDCFLTARDLARKEGLFAGGSSGGAVFGALQVARQAKPDDVIVVVLPDAGNRYLSKFYNDGWMADNAFFPYETMPGRVEELINSGHMKPVVIKAASPIKDAIALMKKYSISQLPVRDNGDIVGMVFEIDLLRALAARTGGPDDPVRDVAERQISKVGPHEPISRLAEIFTEKSEAVLVMRDKDLLGIITKIDLISHLAKNKT
jgi:cystathionine beta-synthase